MLRDFGVHQWTLVYKFSGAISRKSLINESRWCPSKTTNQGVVGSNPAGRAKKSKGLQKRRPFSFPALRDFFTQPPAEVSSLACFGFYPFFFVGTGIKFDVTALGRDLTTMLLVPTFLVLFIVVRGAPVFLYRNDIPRDQRLAFALSSSVASLSIVVVITEIGAHSHTMNPDITAALIGAALLSVLLFPTIAGVLLQRLASPLGNAARP